MHIIDLYTPLRASVGQGKSHYEVFETSEGLCTFLPLARSWKLNQTAIDAWFQSADGKRQAAVAEKFLPLAAGVLKKVESLFGRELPGMLLLMPSFGDFDGFARYELGEHRVMLGIDFPNADLNYLRALTAHELSHVYRDHSPAVWAHLGKPLSEVTRKEYLEASSAQEHLVSEGLATLFSQALFPEIAPHIHHYYDMPEWEWCVQNDTKIESELRACLAGDEDVWSFYGDSRVGPGSPSRTQYYWAARKIAERMDEADKLGSLIRMHALPASDFPVFSHGGGGKTP